MPVDRQPELVTLELLERRRGETWQGLWLAPLLTIVAQGFLLLVLADENVGWLARAAVLAAALAANLAAAWSALRAHAREVQYSEAIAAELAATDGAHDVRPAALARPRRRSIPKPTVTDVKPAPAGKTSATATEGAVEAGPAAEAGPDREGETAILGTDPESAPAAAAGEDPPEPREDWVRRWDRHLAWWAAGESHTKAYMAWVGTLGLFMLADIAAYLATV